MSQPLALTTELIDEAVRRHADERPDDLAFTDPHQSLTWGELNLGANQVASYLAAQDIGVGSRVGWLGVNCAAYPLVLLGAWRRRASLVGLNCRLPVADLRTCGEAVALDHLVASPELGDWASELGTRSTVVEHSAFPWHGMEDDAAEVGPPDPEDEAIIFFTSGATGRSKPVPLTRYAVESTVRYGDVHDFTTRSRMLLVPPSFHAAGGTWVNYGLSWGAHQFLTADTSPSGLVEALASGPISHVILVPTLIHSVVEELEHHPRPLPRLEHVAYGASPITQSLLRRAMARFDCDFSQVYGMTETGGGVSFLTPHDHRIPLGGDATRLASAGRPGADIEVSVRDIVTGVEQPIGEPGELWFRAPTLTRGYLGMPEATRAVLVDGWVNTHDVGCVDEEGYIFVRGRSDDMIQSGAENVHPIEVERVIAQLPEVLDCAVYGIADARWGQKVCASVVLRDERLFPEDVIAHCREQLAGYQCPRIVRVVSDLPRNAAGKLIRAELIRDTEAMMHTTT